MSSGGYRETALDRAAAAGYAQQGAMAQRIWEDYGRPEADRWMRAKAQVGAFNPSILSFIQSPRRYQQPAGGLTPAAAPPATQPASSPATPASVTPASPAGAPPGAQAPPPVRWDDIKSTINTWRLAGVPVSWETPGAMFQSMQDQAWLNRYGADLARQLNNNPQVRDFLAQNAPRDVLNYLGIQPQAAPPTVSVPPMNVDLSYWGFGQRLEAPDLNVVNPDWSALPRPLDPNNSLYLHSYQNVLANVASSALAPSAGHSFNSLTPAGNLWATTPAGVDDDLARWGYGQRVAAPDLEVVNPDWGALPRSVDPNNSFWLHSFQTSINNLDSLGSPAGHSFMLQMPAPNLWATTPAEASVSPRTAQRWVDAPDASEAGRAFADALNAANLLRVNEAALAQKQDAAGALARRGVGASALGDASDRAVELWANREAAKLQADTAAQRLALEQALRNERNQQLQQRFANELAVMGMEQALREENDRRLIQKAQLGQQLTAAENARLQQIWENEMRRVQARADLTARENEQKLQTVMTQSELQQRAFNDFITRINTQRALAADRNQAALTRAAWDVQQNQRSFENRLAVMDWEQRLREENDRRLIQKAQLGQQLTAAENARLRQIQQDELQRQQALADLIGKENERNLQTVMTQSDLQQRAFNDFITKINTQRALAADANQAALTRAGWEAQQNQQRQNELMGLLNYLQADATGQLNPWMGVSALGEYARGMADLAGQQAARAQAAQQGALGLWGTTFQALGSLYPWLRR